jgi:O-antigen ligase
MNHNNIEKIYLFLFSFIPISIVLGPAISLINIITISFVFLVFTIRTLELKFLRNSSFLLLILIYFYLIFNSFISIDFEMGMGRNFGFIRFILLFLTTNYFFLYFKKSKTVYKIWFLVIFVIIIDSFVEFFFGRNILGYGELYGDRIVSFFKDEPIVGAYLNGFILILSGYILDKFFKKKLIFKILALSLILIFLTCVIFTGERSNMIKIVIGLFIFFYLNHHLNLTNKIIMTLLVIAFFSVAVMNSTYLKYRYSERLLLPLIDKDKREKFYKENNYINIYKSGIAVFKNYPIFGVGSKNYRVEIDNNLSNNEDYFINNHPHQVYIEFLAEHGIVGTIILLSIIFTLIFKNLKIIILSRNSIQLGAFIYLIINLLPILPSGSFFSDFNATLFWLNFSIMYACNPQTNIFNKTKNTN